MKLKQCIESIFGFRPAGILASLKTPLEEIVEIDILYLMKPMQQLLT